MPPLPPQEIERLTAAVREAWSNNPAGPRLADILTPAALADNDALIEVFLADAEERSARSLPDALDAYLTIAPSADFLNPILMHLLANQAGQGRASLAADLRSRFPDITGHIDLVLELCDELSDSLTVAAESLGEPQPGQTIGKYRLIARLGRGSFGEVWQALDTELDRYIALKLLYHDAARGEQATLERALAEARAAAALAHENIVTVHAVGRMPPDAGGRFYIDSALVGDSAPTSDDPRRIAIGRPLDALASSDSSPSLPPGEAARIMSAVCRGIAAAHARGVLHRDIKPANILITPSGKPQVADFGLSTTGLPPRKDGEQPHLHSVSLRSESGRRIVGTPAYMSPEQAAGERPTVLSDVYSLGATLRFLLSGSPPFKPSGRFSDDARWDVIAQVRGTREPPPLDGTVPRTLAAICERAMARAPEARYASAKEMAEDLDAWLTHRPTRAAPPTPAGAAALWCRRNAALAALLFIALLAATAGAAAYIIRIGEERDRAVAAERLAEERLAESETARAIAETTSEFLDGILASPDPRMEGKDATVLSALNRSSTLIAQRLKGQEQVEAAVRTSIGHAYRALEDIKSARPHLDRALEIRTRIFGLDHPATLKTRHELAMVTALDSKVEDAILMMKEIVAASREALGDDHPDTVQAINDLGATLAWSPRPEALDEALEAYKEATERRLRLYGPDDRRTLDSKKGWAGIYYSKGRPAECEPMIREIVEAFRRIADPTDIERLGATRDLAVILRVQGKNDEALPLLQEAYDGLKAQMPPGHIDLLSAGITLAGVLNSLGKGEEALGIARDISAAADQHLGEENTFRWMTHISIGDSYTTLGRFEDAEAEMIPAYDNIVKVIGRDGRTSRSAARQIVRLYEKWEKPEEAEKWKERTVRSATPSPPADPPK